MNDDLLSFSRSWDGFLPANAVVMGRVSNAPVSTSSPHEVSFLFFAPGADLPASRELLDKIIAALQLKNEEYVVASEVLPNVTPKIAVRFTLSASEAADAGRWVSEGETTESIRTFSLASMLENAAMKKPVWNHLKDALARLRGGTSS